MATEDVEVRRRWVVPRREFDEPTGFGAFAQLLHASIDVGIARAALRDAAEFVRTRTRPWYEAGVAHAEEDPLTAQRFGELDVDRLGPGGWLTALGVLLGLTGLAEHWLATHPRPRREETKERR